MNPTFKDFNERMEKRIPNERQLVALLKRRIREKGLGLIDHNRLAGGFDIIYQASPDISVGIEVKSESYLSHILMAIGQCVYRLGRGDADKAVVYTNFSIPNGKQIKQYIENMNLPISFTSIEEVDGKPYFVSDEELKDWIKIG